MCSNLFILLLFQQSQDARKLAGVVCHLKFQKMQPLKKLLWIQRTILVLLLKLHVFFESQGSIHVYISSFKFASLFFHPRSFVFILLLVNTSCNGVSTNVMLEVIHAKIQQVSIQIRNCGLRLRTNNFEILFVRRISVRLFFRRRRKI